MNKSSCIVASMLLISMSSFAQSLNTNSDGWSTINIQWNPSTFVPDKGDSESFTGFSLGYNKAFGISKSIPLYFEVGLGMQYSFYSKDLTEDVAKELGVTPLSLATLFRPEEKINMLSAKVPLSLAYAFHFPESSLTLIPYLGLDMRFNIIAKGDLKYNLTSAGINQLKQNGYTQEKINDEYGDKNIDLFDKKDMGSDAATWNRFQIGWHIGLNARIKDKFLIGASYGTDFSETAQKMKIHTVTLMVGYCF